jgi:hypothetical protein
VLEKCGLVERDYENAWLAADLAGSGPLDGLDIDAGVQSWSDCAAM